MKPIGGYFGLELSRHEFPNWLSNAIAVNSSRHALEYILKSIAGNLKRIYVPFFTCEVVLEPINRLGIEYQFYHINDRLEIDTYPLLNDDEMIIVNNYFGIKDNYINEVLAHYGNKVIVDNAQAFYHYTTEEINAIYSPRKFFGVADGGFALAPNLVNTELERDSSVSRMSHLLKRIDAGAEAGYKDFQFNDSSISSDPLKSMSALTYSILGSIDYAKVKDARRKNFAQLHASLERINAFEIPSLESFKCPMVYPFWTDDESIRQRLLDNKIFVATYWPNVFEWCDTNSIEYKLAKQIIPLPIDQRYCEAEMEQIINVICNGK